MTIGGGVLTDVLSPVLGGLGFPADESLLHVDLSFPEL